MKLITIIAMLSAAVVLSAAETALWDGSKAELKPIYSKITEITAENGVLTISGKNNAVSGKTTYLDCRMNIAPIVVKGKKLSITIEPLTYVKGDSIYVKGVTADKKIVFSHVAYNLPKAKKTYVIDPAATGTPFRKLDRQISAPADAQVTTLQFFYGRTAQDADMKVNFSDIKLID